MGGRYDMSPLSGPFPGSRIKAISHQQKTRKCCPWAAAQVPLERGEYLDTLLGMHVQPHMCHAPVRFGMLATSRIHRSVHIFRDFSVIHPPLRFAHPSLLSTRKPTPNSFRSCVAPAIGRGSPRAFGFLLTDRMPKETCEERTVCRMMRTNGYWIRFHERILD